MADDYPLISWLNAGRLLNRGVDAVPQMLNSGIDSGIGALSGLFAPAPEQPPTVAETIRKRMQAASAPDRMPFGVGSPAEVGLQAPTGLESAIGGAINETASLPRRAIEAAQQSAAQRVSPLNMAEDDPRLDRRFGALGTPPMDPLVPIGVETALTGMAASPFTAVKDAAGAMGGRLLPKAEAETPLEFARSPPTKPYEMTPTVQSWNPLDNAEQGRIRAIRRRGDGLVTGKSAPGWDYKVPDPEKGSLDEATAKARAGFKADASEAQATYADATNPYMTPADHAEIERLAQKRGGFTLGANQTDEAGAARSAALVGVSRETPPLPMDEVSRMARAKEQGFNIDAYHGTDAPVFDAFKRKRNDIGIHFGTAEQAGDRVAYMKDAGRVGEDHVYPVKLKINNPLRLPDLGNWNSENVQQALFEMKRPDGGKVFDPEALRRAAFSSGNEAGRTAAIRDLIKSKGYDGIVYRNTGETGGSEPFRQAVKDAREEMDQAFGGPKYSFNKEEQANPAYQKYSAAQDVYKAHRETNAQDSYIAFHPEQVRSRFAEFNPKNKGKGFLLGANTADEAGAARAAALNVGLKAGDRDAARAGTEAERAAANPGTGGGGGVGGLEQAQATAARWAGAKNPLAGLPGAVKIGGEHFVPGPIGTVHDVAEDYMRSTGRLYEPPTQHHPLDPEHSTAIAKAFDEMPHTPDDPATKASYKALIDETLGQYQAMKKSGLKVEFIEPGMPDPYAINPRLAAKDVAENNHLWVYPTDSGFGSAGPQAGAHPMLAQTGETISGKPAVANDIFRAVHDYFGHLKEGHGFRAAGEDNAWRSHAAMYSDIARPAMTTETRGQNSWVNYGPHGENNRSASAADTVYADQKVGLMPEWTMRDRGSPDPIVAYHGSPHDVEKFSLDKIGSGEGNQAYGHGLYFAEHEPVSTWYRSQLAARRDPLLQKYGLDSEDGANIGVTLANSGGKTEPVIADLQDRIAKLEASGNRTAADRNVMARMQGKLAYLQDPERAVGHQYQVRIKAKPEEFLEWDKPLGEQSPYVQEKLRSANLGGAEPPKLTEIKDPEIRSIVRRALRDNDGSFDGLDLVIDNDQGLYKAAMAHAKRKGANLDDFSAGDHILKEARPFLRKLHQTQAVTGESIMNSLLRTPTGPASDSLRAAGIKGVKYPDQLSRDLGHKKPTSNYVVFDDKTIEILRKYGLAGLPAGAGGAAAFGAIGKPSEAQAMDDTGFRQSPNVEDRSGEGVWDRYKGMVMPTNTWEDIMDMVKHPLTVQGDLRRRDPPGQLGNELGYNDIKPPAKRRAR